MPQKVFPELFNVMSSFSVCDIEKLDQSKYNVQALISTMEWKEPPNVGKKLQNLCPNSWSKFMFIHLHRLIASIISPINNYFLRQSLLRHSIPCGKEFLYDLSRRVTSSRERGGSGLGWASGSSSGRGRGAWICLIPAQFVGGFGREGRCVTATTERCLPLLLLLAHWRTLDRWKYVYHTMNT
jgi:hypothetical protein